MSHSIEQVLNNVTVWCEQSSLSELVTFDLSYKRISKCKTRVRPGCILVLLHKIDFQQWRLSTFFWGRWGIVCEGNTGSSNSTTPHLRPPPPIHQLWDDRWRRWLAQFCKYVTAIVVCLSRPTPPGIWAPADLVCWCATICLIFFLGFKKSYSILAQKDTTKLKRIRLCSISNKIFALFVLVSNIWWPKNFVRSTLTCDGQNIWTATAQKIRHCYGKQYDLQYTNVHKRAKQRTHVWKPDVHTCLGRSTMITAECDS